MWDHKVGAQEGFPCQSQVLTCGSENYERVNLYLKSALYCF